MQSHTRMQNYHHTFAENARDWAPTSLHLFFLMPVNKEEAQSSRLGLSVADLARRVDHNARRAGQARVGLVDRS
jgi:hypothetical protein